LIREGQGIAGFLVSNVPVTRRVLEALPELRVIVKYGIGVDNIDTTAATEPGKAVARVPGYCREEVALHTLSPALNGLRRTHTLGAQVAGGRWNDFPEGLILYRPSEVRLGIVGLGNIGRLFARYSERFFRSVHYYDPYVRPPAQALRYRRERSLGAVFAQCSVVSLQRSAHPGNPGIHRRDSSRRGAAVGPDQHEQGCDRGARSAGGHVADRQVVLLRSGPVLGRAPEPREPADQALASARGRADHAARGLVFPVVQPGGQAAGGGRGPAGAQGRQSAAGGAGR
jgi:hypothetical protein